MEYFLKLLKLTRLALFYIMFTKFSKLIVLFFLIISLSSFSATHKYYVSVTQVEYSKENKSIQIILRLFTDDIENVLRERYDEDIILGESKDNAKTNDSYIQKYLNSKLNIKVNENKAHLTFIGKEVNVDITRCFLEIENINEIKSFEISNKLLFDLFEEQQNIVKLNINSKQKSYILTNQDYKTVLKF